MKNKKKVEISFVPQSFETYDAENSIAVIVDILRATTSIVTAFMNGVNTIIPVGTLEEAKAYKEKGFIVAAERDGVIRDFADFGNSPENFTKEAIGGKDVAYSTTNGTKAVQMASICKKVTIGSFLNITALANWLIEQNEDVIIFCAGWKGKFSLEDSVFAGALAEKILANDNFSTICDSTHAAMDLWSEAKQDLVAYIDKAANRTRLKKLGLDNCIEYSHTLDQTDIVPVLRDVSLVNVKDLAGVEKVNE